MKQKKKKNFIHIMATVEPLLWDTSTDPLIPSIKIQILLPCVYMFLAEVVGRKC